MDQNFSLMAQSRANYYTAGSPVQFVRVELLKGDVTGEVAVCLTFKNVGTEPLTGLVVHFKCKDAAGQVLCEDDFYYEQLNAQPGAVFGSDDAVYVSDTPVSSVEVEQDRASPEWPRRRPAQLQARAPEYAPPCAARLHFPHFAAAHRQCAADLRAPGYRVRLALRLRRVPAQTRKTPPSAPSAAVTAASAIKATLTGISEEARQAAERQQQEVNAVANSVAPAPAPQPQAQPAPCRY